MADGEKQMENVENFLATSTDDVNLTRASTSRTSDEVLSPINNKKPLSSDERTYMMESFEKKYLLLFIQQDLNELDFSRQKATTEKNIFILEKTFQMFGFEIEQCINLTKDEIFEKLEVFEKKDFSEYGCIVVMVLTNETFDGSLRANGDGLYRERDIITYFKNKKNLSMVTKPKMLIIQSHRESKPTTVTQGEGKTYKDEYQYDSCTLPLSSDILVLRSSYPGSSTHEGEKDGSWFIRTLCREIVRNSPKLDFECIITIVRRKVAQDMKYIYRAVTTDSDKYNLMPVSTSTLIRKLYFRKYKDYSIDEDFEKIFD